MIYNIIINTIIIINIEKRRKEYSPRRAEEGLMGGEREERMKSSSITSMLSANIAYLLILFYLFILFNIFSLIFFRI